MSGLKYSEWNAKGYRIHRGQKAISQRDGENVFLLSQVYDPQEINLSQKHENYLICAQAWEEMPH